MNKKNKKLPKDIIPTNNIEDIYKIYDSITKANKNKPSITLSELNNIYDYNVKKNNINEDIFTMLPDIKMAIEIMTSTIIAPIDMNSTVLTYNINNNNLPVNISLMISGKIMNYIKDNYNLVDKLPTIIEESLFTKGAYAELIIPSMTVTKIFNKYKKVILEAGMESATIIDSVSKDSVLIKSRNDDLLNITDNVGVLVTEELIEESTNLNLDKEYLGYEYDLNNDVLILEETDITDNKPIVKKINASAVIPISSKNDPSKHYGYFIILDSNGEVIDNKKQNVNVTLDNFLKNTTSTSMERIMNRAKKLLKDTTIKAPDLKNKEILREVLIKQQLTNVIKDSKLNNISKIDFEYADDLLDIILYRMLKGMKTNILFVPKDMLIYYAYNYRENGTGKSILEEISVLASIRVMTMFVNLLAYIKSSIPVTKVDAKLDENDPDYAKTMNKIITEVMKNRQVTLPIGVMKIDDVVDWVHKVGFSFNFEHPGLPDVEINISDDTFKIEPVEDDLVEDIDKKIMKTIGVPPEMLEESFTPDFATTVVANNVMFNRRIRMYQKVYNKLITEHVKKILKADGVIGNEIKSLLQDNLKEIRRYMIKTTYNVDRKKVIKETDDLSLINYLYNKIINGIEITLPEPMIEDESNLKKQFDKYKDEVDDFIDVMFDSELLPDDIMGEFADKIDVVKHLIKAIALKRWIDKNGYLQDISSLFAVDKDGKPIFNILEEYKSHVEILEKSILPFLKEMNKYKSKLENKIDKLENDDEENDDEENEDVTNNENTNEENDNEKDEDTANNENNDEEVDKDVDELDKL